MLIISFQTTYVAITASTITAAFDSIQFSQCLLLSCIICLPTYNNIPGNFNITFIFSPYTWLTFFFLINHNCLAAFWEIHIFFPSRLHRINLSLHTRVYVRIHLCITMYVCMDVYMYVCMFISPVGQYTFASFY